MTVPAQMFDFLIEPIREADKREGKDFLERYLRGPQTVWEETDQKIKDIPKLWSVVDCPDDFLKYLKWIVGWTSQLDSVTKDLVFDELRRLISISGRLWKLRGSDDTIVDVMRFSTGQRNRIWSWFDFRWVLADEGGTPDNVTKPNGYLKFEINGILGTSPRPGTPMKAEYIPTTTSEDDLLSKWDSVNSVNYVETTTTLGQGGSPSLVASDYLIFDKVHLGTEFGEEHEGRDPWLIGLDDAYESNLRIVLNPGWSAAEKSRMQNLIINLLKLMRATGERWEVVYLGLLDQFIVDGDDTQWYKTVSVTPVVEDGVMKIGGAALTAQFVTALDPNAKWLEQVVASRIRGWVSDPDDSFWVLLFCYTDTSNTYVLEIYTTENNNGPKIVLTRYVTGTPTTLATADLSGTPFYEAVWYTYRATVAQEGSDLRIKVFLDGDEVIDALDTSPLSQGTVGVGSDFAAIECDEFEVIPLPVEDDYVDINS